MKSSSSSLSLNRGRARTIRLEKKKKNRSTRRAHSNACCKTRVCLRSDSLPRPPSLSGAERGLLVVYTNLVVSLVVTVAGSGCTSAAGGGVAWLAPVTRQPPYKGDWIANGGPRNYPFV